MTGNFFLCGGKVGDISSGKGRSINNARAFIHSSVIFLVCCLVVVAAQCFGQENDSSVSELEMRKQVSQQSAELLRAEKFDELEKTAEELRTTKARFPSGYWKLYNFYGGIEAPRGNFSGHNWEVHLALLEKWRSQYPQSITAHTALAAAYVQFAWQARGSGYIDTVTKEGGELFVARLHQAEEYVGMARKLPGADPQLDYVNLFMAKGLGWEWGPYNKVFDEAVKREPGYLYLYFQKANYSLPRWHGKRGDVEKFALAAMRMTPKGDGKAIYAYLAVYLRQYLEKNERLFEVYRLSWPDVREGFRDMEKQYPHSVWNLNQFCLVACIARDAKTAHELFERIGDRWEGDIWHNEGQYRKWKNWAERPATRTEATEEKTEESSRWRRMLDYLRSWW